MRFPNREVAPLRSSSIRSVLLAATVALAAALGSAAPASADVAGPVGVVAPFSPVEATPFSGTVAQFASVGATGPAFLKASVVWGDGTSSAATSITSPASQEFVVDAAHTYARVGSYTVTVTLRFASNDVIAASATAVRTVADAPFTAIPLAQDWTLAAAFSGVVGSFTDPDPNPPADDFTAPDAAVIDWGDGTEGFGSIVRRGDGTFQVRGGHTWKTPGVFAVTSLVNAKSGSTLRIRSTIRVLGIPKPAFSVSPLRRCAEHPLTFTASVTGAAPPIVRHRWTFRGGGAFEPATVVDTGASPVVERTFGYTSYEVPLPIEDPDTGELTVRPPTRYFRAPVDVTLQVTDSTGQTASVTRTITFFDDGFRPTAAQPKPNCAASIFERARLASVKLGSLVGATSGGFAARIGCVKVADCLVRVLALPKRGTTALGRTTGLVKAGTARTLTVRLTRAARRTLARKGRLAVRLVIVTGDGRGRGTTAVRSAVLRLK